MPVARVQFEDGRIGRFEVPEGTTPEQAQAFITQTSRPEEGFLTRFTEAQEARGAQLADVFTGEGAAEQTLPETLLQVAGTEIGAAGDIAGQAIAETARAGFAALPEEAQQGLSKLGTEFLQSSVGQAGIQALQSGTEAFAEFEKNNPRAARNIKSVVNVALFATPIKGVSGATLARKGVERGAEAFGSVVPSVVGGVARGAEAAGEGVAKAGEVGARLARGVDADSILANRISATDATQALQELKSGEISVLADVAGDEIQGFTRAVGKVSGGARNIVSSALEGRSEEAVGRVSTALSKNISNVESYFGNLDDLAKARATIATPLYKEAFKANKVIVSKEVDRILETPAGRRALQQAVVKMQNDRSLLAVPDKELGEQIRLAGIEGTGAIGRGLNLRSLDYVKRSLDDQIGVAIRTGEADNVRILSGMKKGLVRELDKADITARAGPRSFKPEGGAYKRARKVFSDFKSLEDAQQAGLDFTKHRPEQLKIFLRELDNTQKEAFKIGVRENLQKIVSTTADQADPAKRVFGNQFKRDQIKAVFGEGKQINEFTKRMTEEIRAAKTKFRVLGGSRTDINIANDVEFIDAASQATRQGLIRTSIEKAVESIAGAAKRRWTGLNSQNATKLAKILTDRDAGIEALERLIKNAAKDQKLILQDAVKELQ